MSEGVMEDTKLVQIFLGGSGTPGPGIFEVSINRDRHFICTCPGYAGRGTCKHTKFVTSRVKQNHGTYPLQISTEVTDEETDRAHESSEELRKFIIKFGKIEVC